MNFQSLQNIEKPNAYLDVAFSRAKKKADGIRHKKFKDRITKSKQIEIIKLTTIKDSIVAQLDRIIKSYPSIDDLAEFYQKLIRISLDYSKLKKSLGGVNWAIKKTIFFYSNYKRKIIASQTFKDINNHRRVFYGRLSSVLKQIEKELAYLEHARKVMVKFPNVKTSIKTIAIVGFPNIGKTTLLSKLTDSKPEIQSYAFTTKKINIGYIKTPSKKVQILDTPGTLDRIDKMNDIERIAYLAMKYCADEFIYVFDLTEPYPLKDQMKLLRRIKEFDKPIAFYLSKTDLLTKDQIKNFKLDVILDIEKLKKLALK